MREASDSLSLAGTVGPAAPACATAQPDAAVAAVTPLLKGGESHFQEVLAQESGALSSHSEKIVFDGKETKILPACRRIPGQLVGIDYVSCVWRPDEDEIQAWHGQTILGYQERHEITASFIRFRLLEILGLPVSSAKSFQYGLNMYRYAIKLPLDAGIVHVGHKSGTTLVTISGQGALVCAPGWEKRLHDFLVSVEGWLTRVDLAFDDFEGKYFAVRRVREDAKTGAFQRMGRPPHFEQRGNWESDDPDHKGLTFYVGSRTSGKFCRVYEKGLQLGDKTSPWVRFEIEYRSSGFVLPLEILLRPTQYFVAAYPLCERIEDAPERIDLEYRARSVSTSYEKVIANVKHQYGAHLNALRQLHADSELLDLVCRDGDVDWLNTFNRVTDLLLDPVINPNAETVLSGEKEI